METRFDAANEWLDRQDVERSISEMRAYRIDFAKRYFNEACNVIALIDEYKKAYRYDSLMKLRLAYWVEQERILKTVLGEKKTEELIVVFKEEYAELHNFYKRNFWKGICHTMRWNDHALMDKFFTDLSWSEHTLIAKILEVLKILDKQKGMAIELIDERVCESIKFFDLANNVQEGRVTRTFMINAKGKKALSFKSNIPVAQLSYFVEYIGK